MEGVPSDLPLGKTREQAGNARGLSAESNPHGEGQKRENDRERERGRATERDREGEHTFFFLSCRQVHILGTQQKEGR